jgi:hypothetical protein
MRAWAVTAGLALVLGSGCDPIADRCRDQTLLLMVTLEGDSASADTLALSFALDGVAAAESSVTHTPGQASGNIEVAFPKGYPRGQLVTATLRALAAGTLVGNGSAEQRLDGGCAVAPLAVHATGAPADLAGAADLAQADLSSLAGADMTCVPSAESGDACFDGLDNDCDGHVDCEDPDCGNGQCVPAASAAFALGIRVPQASFCPAMFGAKAVINRGIGPVGADCATSGCSCTPAMNCSANVTSWPASGCSGESDGNTSGSTCRNFNFSSATKGISTESIVNGGASCGAGGTSARSATQWTATERFCQATAIGGGCGQGSVCVPKTSVAACELADSAVGCDNGYTEVSGPWFTGFDDSRSCACSCGAASGGSCGTTFAFYTSNNCSGTAALTMAANQMQCSVAGGYHSTQLTGGSAPSCGSAGATLSGSLTGTGRQTLCCR